MINVTKKENCCGCHACFNICPKNAIEMKEDEMGFKYPVIDKDKCIDCGLCEKVCPIFKNIKVENKIESYACYNKNTDEILNSSSGGIFILLAKEILSRDGVVFGAYFDEDFKVKHGFIQNEKDISKFMGSKYVQSTIGDCYKKAKEMLDKDKYVLFTGTPCQIEGLKSYLMKDYKKLYTQDIICHGVPSPLVWEKYKEYREKKDKNKPVQINFRQKDYGWNLYALLLQYNNSAYNKEHSEDLFMRVFLSDLVLRDSCYNCNFKKYNRLSDITLADFWGIKNVNSKMYNDKGTSLVIVNSAKGQELFNNIKEKIVYEKVNTDEAIKYNSAFISSAKYNNNRENFYKDLDNMEFDKLVKKYVPQKPLKHRIVQKSKNIVKRYKHRLSCMLNK